MSNENRLPEILNPTEEDMQLLLAANCHIGAKNVKTKMVPYVYKRRQDGLNVIDIGKTWEKLILAARIIVAIENPKDVIVLSARPYGHRAALKFAKYIGAEAIVGRFTPGTFTNYNTRSFREPRLVICTDPYTDFQAIKEASYVNIPVISLADVDSLLQYVDVAIPTNNKGKHAIGLIYWLLARAVLRLRGTLDYTTPWDVMVDMFFYRDPEEVTKETNGELGDAIVDEASDNGEWSQALDTKQGTDQDWSQPEPEKNAVQDWSADQPSQWD